MRGLEFELDQLLNPAAVFDHPRDVLKDPDLTRQEKRAILSSWASDACAVDSAPTLRHPPGVKAPVSFDDSVDALRSLDDDPTRPRPGGIVKRLKSKWRHEATKTVRTERPSPPSPKEEAGQGNLSRLHAKNERFAYFMACRRRASSGAALF